MSPKRSRRVCNARRKARTSRVLLVVPSSAVQRGQHSASLPAQPSRSAYNVGHRSRSHLRKRRALAGTRLLFHDRQTLRQRGHCPFKPPAESLATVRNRHTHANRRAAIVADRTRNRRTKPPAQPRLNPFPLCSPRSASVRFVDGNWGTVFTPNDRRLDVSTA